MASNSREKALSADWMAETWVRISVQYHTFHAPDLAFNAVEPADQSIIFRFIPVLVAAAVYFFGHSVSSLKLGSAQPQGIAHHAHRA